MDVMENTERQQEEIVNSGNQPVIQPENSVQAQTTVTQPKMSYELDDYARQDGENIFDYISRVGKEKAEEYRTNVDRYTIRLRPEEYAQVNEVINATPDVQENSYKVAAAMKYSKLYEIPLEEAYANLDQFNYSIFGEEANKGYTKNFWNTLCDMLQLGQNTVDIGMIGGQLREAIDTGNTERANELRELYAKYKEQNDFLQQNLPQNLAMKIVESGAQSLPFTMGAIGMSVISPVTGFVYSAGVMAGQEYLDLTEAGASHETAKGVSTVVGAINGIVEVELGNVAGALGSKAAGSKAGELLRRNVIDKVTKNVAQKMHYSGGWRIVANVLTRSAMENLEEGAEEAVQETFSLLGKYIANEIDDLGIEGMTAGEIAKDLGENFMGGVYGSILLGSGTLISNSIAAKADYDAVKTAAEIIPSEKSFTKAVENSPVFEEMNEETKAQTIHEIYQNFGSKRDADIQKKAESLTEVISADEGMENYEAETDENGNELEAPEVPAETRDDNGKLYSQQAELTENADGTYSGKKVYGDATKENNNQYGYISYTIDEEAGTVTIDDFKTNKYRQYLNNEMFTDFANEMKDYDIQWNPSLEDAKKWKADIEALNPSGKENGLNYFSTKNQTAESKADQQTRQRLVRELSQKFNLKGEEKALTVAMVEAMANSQGKSVSEWISEKFQDSGIMGNIAELEEAARQESIKQGKEIKATGGMTLIDTVKGVKAVIYAAEGADFSTALHEFSHVWTKGLSGDLEAEAANVFGATQNKDGSYNWDAPVTLENGKTVSAYENLAYSYEKWLETGKAPTPQHENIFKKFAEFMKNCVKTLRSAVKLTPETEDFFNKYFNVTEGMLKNAENAVIAEQENTGKILEGNTSTQENLGKISEVDAIPTEELLKAFEENNKEETPAESAVKETKLDPVTQEAVTSILEDPEIPAEKKVAAVMKANGEAFIMKQENIEFYKNRADLTEEERAQAVKDLEENNDTDRAGTGIPMSLLESGKSMLFQIIGEKGAKALDEANEETIRMDNKAIAEEMEAAGKDAKSIRLATGWEKGADGQWKYEIEDFQFDWDKLKNSVFSKEDSKNLREEIKDFSILPLNEVLKNNAALLKAYPSLKEYKIGRANNIGLNTAGVNLENKLILFKSEYAFDEVDENDWLTKTLREDIAEAERHIKDGYTETELSNLAFYDEKPKTKEELQNEINEKTERLNNHLNIVKTSREELSKSLAHEIQHLIQLEEGFAKGGTLGTVDGEALATSINKNFREAVKEIEETEAFKNAYERIADEYGRDRGGWKSHAYFEALKAVGFDYTEADEKRAEKVKWYTDSYSTYKAIAGETESRNVEKRYGMTMEERRAQLLEETEDVPRNAQIVLFQEENADNNGMLRIKSGLTNTNKIVDYLEEKLKSFGYEVTREYSGLSNSQYLNITNYTEKTGKEIPYDNLEYKIRISDHDLPPSYDTLHGYHNMDIRSGKNKRGGNNGDAQEYSNAIQQLWDELTEKPELKSNSIDTSNFPEWAVNIGDTYEAFKAAGKGVPYFISDIMHGGSWSNYKKPSKQQKLKKLETLLTQNGTSISELVQQYDGRNELVAIAKEIENKKKESDPSILFQTAEPGTEFQIVYHGSPHILRKAGGTEIRGEELGFDHSKMGTGEGAQAFGWGSYVTQVQGIADDYARKLSVAPGTLFVSLEGKKDFIKQRKASLRNLDNGKYEDRINKNIKNFTKELKAAQKANDEGDIKFYEGLIASSEEDLKPEVKEKYRKAFLEDIEKTQAEIKELQDKIKEYKKAVANTYTLNIPADGENYLQWDKGITPEQYQRIVNQAEAEDLKLYSGEDQYSVADYGLTTTDGEKLYKELIKETRKTDKEISEFLNRAGFNGISYPANATTGGREDGARNFVIFNEDDIQITEWHGKDINGNFLFQNEVNDDILNTAAGFDNWVEFMEYIQNVEPEMAPEEAASDWYLNTWEIAHNVSPTTAEREAQIMADREVQNNNEKKDPVFLDGLFLHEIQKSQNLENFLKLSNTLEDVTDEQINALDEEDRAYILNNIEKIKTVLNHPTIKTARKALINKDELAPKHRQRVINLMKGRLRDYRAIFANLTGRTEYSVDSSESLDAELANRARRFNLIKYDSEIENMSPEQKRALESYIKDKEVLKKFKEDKVKMNDPDIEHYIDLLESQLRTMERDMGKARREFQDDMEALGGVQARDILRQYEEFLNLKSEADYKKIPLPAGSKEAVRIGERAKRDNAVGMKQSYNTLAAHWDTFKKEVEAKIRLQERLRAEGKISELEEKIKADYDAKRMKIMLSKLEALNAMNKEYGDKRRESIAARQLKDLRKVLVKRVMRRVNFYSIDYDQAKKIIAIQKVFEPNLRGGINKWIGTENKLAREIWSAWNTDEFAKEKMLERLSNKGKTDLIKLLEDTKDIVDFEKWTSKEKKALERAMPRQNWIKDLNLDVWKEERDNALQLPIKEVLRYDYEIQPDGSKRAVPYTGVEITPEIERLLVESIGEDLAYAINNRHFEDWTTGEMEELARRINILFKEGRDRLNAKREAEKSEADRIRNLIDQTIKDTGIVIEPDDPEEVKAEKQAKIDKILGVKHSFPGTEASKREKSQIQSWLDRIMHGYHDANVRRVARILDNYDEGTITNLLYFRENDCFNKKQRAIDRRNEKIEKVISDNKLDIRKLGNVIKLYDRDFTIDEILMLHAAQMNQDEFYAEQLGEDPNLEPQYAEKESAYQAIMYGNLIFPEERDKFRKMDMEILKKEQERLDKLHAAELAGNEEEINKYKMREASTVDINGELLMEGTLRLKSIAETRFNDIIQGTMKIREEFLPLIEAIRADYAEEFDNINRVSIEQFNAPVWREKWYLPLVRLTAAGDTHEERVKQDLLGHTAGAGKAGTEKGFTKKRVKIGPLNQAPVELGLYTTWTDSVERNEHFVAYAGLVREYNRVFDSRDALGMMQDMENRYGHAMTDYIKTYIKEVANPRIISPQKGLDKVMHIMRGNTAPAYLGWKFSSILKQGIESPAPFMQFINPAEYMHAAIRMTIDKNVRDGIEIKSAFMKSRVFDPMVDLINENVEKSMNKPNYLLKKFQQTGMAGLEWIDWACVAPGWLAIYEKEYNKLQTLEQALYEERVAELRRQNETRHIKYRMTEEEIHQQAMDDVSKDIEAEAVLKADDCVRLCQPSNRNVDLAPMFKNNSEAAKAVLQFQTALNVIWQNIRYDIPYAMRKKEWKQIVGMILGYIMAGVISGVVTAGLLKKDVEPEDAAKKIGYYATTQFLDSFPIVGGNLDRLAEKAITGEGGTMFGSSLWPTFDKYYNAASSLISKDYEKALKNVASGLAITLGFPLSGTKEAMRAVGVGDGDGELELKPEALAGRRD